MVILTFLGRLLVVLALGVLGLGLWLWLSGADVTQQAGQLWFAMDLESLNGAQVLIQRHLHLPWLWDEGVVPLLRRPTWEAILWLVIPPITSHRIASQVGPAVSGPEGAHAFAEIPTVIPDGA